MASPVFSWVNFLLGFAIALWIALVLLFIIPRDEPARPISTCSHVGCGSCCADGSTYEADDLWIPDGNEPYFCTNNDNGGAVVQDNGGAIVQDNGGAVVQDNAASSPAPTDDVLGAGEDRDYHEYTCSTNDNGGGLVQDNMGRDVVVPMERGPEFFCWSSNGNATVLEKLADNDYRHIWYDVHQSRQSLPVPITDPEGAVQSPSTGDGFDYCVVPEVEPEATPRIVEQDNSCLAMEGGC